MIRGWLEDCGVTSQWAAHTRCLAGAAPADAHVHSPSHRRQSSDDVLGNSSFFDECLFCTYAVLPSFDYMLI